MHGASKREGSTSIASMLQVSTQVFPDIHEWLQGASQEGRCIWTSDSELQIDLGAGAAIVPGNQLTFRAGTTGIRTRNGVSDATTSSFAVSLPLQVVSPGIILAGSSVCYLFVDTFLCLVLRWLVPRYYFTL